MDISATRRQLLVATIGLIGGSMLPSCTQATSACIRVSLDGFKKLVNSEIEQICLSQGWRKTDRSSAVEVYFRRSDLPTEYLHFSARSTKFAELCLVAGGTDRFVNDAVQEYRRLVEAMQGKFGDAVKFDIETTSGQALFK